MNKDMDKYLEQIKSFLDCEYNQGYQDGLEEGYEHGRMTGYQAGFENSDYRLGIEYAWGVARHVLEIYINHQEDEVFKINPFTDTEHSVQEIDEMVAQWIKRKNNIEIKKFKLVDAQIVGIYPLQMVEGKFLDIENTTSGHDDVYVYANISNFEVENVDDSDVRIYSHSFADLYCPEDYEICTFDNYTDEIKAQLMQTDAYKEFKKRYESKGE